MSTQAEIFKVHGGWVIVTVVTYSATYTDGVSCAVNSIFVADPTHKTKPQRA